MEYSIQTVSLTMEIYLPMADGDAITKWDKEFVAEMLYRNVSNGR